VDVERRKETAKDREKKGGLRKERICGGRWSRSA